MEAKDRLRRTAQLEKESKDKLPENSKTSSCSKDFCRLGCVCESLQSGKPRRNHCGNVECMFVCTCRYKLNGKLKRRLASRKRKLINGKVMTNGKMPLVNGFLHDYIKILPSSKSKRNIKRKEKCYLNCCVKLQRIESPKRHVNNASQIYAFSISEDFSRMSLRKNQSNINSLANRCKMCMKDAKLVNSKHLNASNNYRISDSCKPCSVVLERLDIVRDPKFKSTIDPKLFTSQDCEKSEATIDTNSTKSETKLTNLPMGSLIVNDSVKKQSFNVSENNLSCYVLLERL